MLKILFCLLLFESVVIQYSVNANFLKFFGKKEQKTTPSIKNQFKVGSKGELKVDSKTERLKNFEKFIHNSNLEDLSKKYGLIVEKKAAIKKPSAIMGRSSIESLGTRPEDLEQEVKDATPGKCDPKPVCISNPLTFNITSTQYAFPPCINIHRCDGCCPSNEKCVAIQTQEVKLQKVGIINFDGESEPKYDETSVSVQNHTECQCQCQWETDDDCRHVNSNYIRNPLACECVCPEELFCDAFHEFDRVNCKCKCKTDKFSKLEQNCKFRGFNWNENHCRCEAQKPPSG